MSKKLRMLSLLLAISAAMITKSQSIEKDGLSYWLSGDTADVTGPWDEKVRPTLSQAHIRSFIEYEGTEYPVASIRGNAFSNCISLTDVSIPGCIKEIGISAFANCVELTGISFPNALQEIKPHTCRGCGKLVSVTFPEELEKIGDRAFQGCGFSTIIIPPKVTTIENCAFNECENLRIIHLPMGITNVGLRSFYGNAIVVSVGSETPPAIEGDTFSDYTYANGTLIVPVGCRQKYYATKGWENFKHIEEVEDPTLVLPKNMVSNEIAYSDGILTLPEEGKMKVDVYAEDGTSLFSGWFEKSVPLSDLPSGLYIVRVSSADGKRTVRKILR